MSSYEEAGTWLEEFSVLVPGLSLCTSVGSLITLVFLIQLEVLEGRGWVEHHQRESGAEASV